MKLTLAEPNYLKDSISIISELVSEARFNINKNGIELIAMDPANVAMVIFKLLSSSFTEYSVKEDTSIAINLNNLKQILKRVGSDDILSLELEENQLKLTIKSHSTRTFSLPVIDIEEKNQEIPNLHFPLTIKVKSFVLTNAIEDAGIVADAISFIADQKRFLIKAEGSLSKASIEVGEAEIKTEKQIIKAKYSVEYLKKMVQGSKIAEEVVIQFDNDYPLKLDYRVTDKIQLAFILAPRVESE